MKKPSLCTRAIQVNASKMQIFILAMQLLDLGILEGDLIIAVIF